MSAETILSIAALVVSAVSIVLSAVTNIRTSKINNIKDYKDYEKNITYFELRYKDEQWLYNLIQNDELRLYNRASQKRIFKWWEKYREKHLPVLLMEQVEFKKQEILNSIKLGPKDFKDNDKSDGSTDW